MSAEQVEIINDFEGAMIGAYNLEKSNLNVELKREKVTTYFKRRSTDYNLHFNFGLRNSTSSIKRIYISIGCSEKEVLPHRNIRLWKSNSPDGEYEMFHLKNGITDLHGKYRFEIMLDGADEVYLANFPPRKYSFLTRAFENLENKSGAKKGVIGKTIENRDIISYEYGDVETKPLILVTSGFHPPEGDTYASEAIMELFLDKKWKDERLRNFSFSFIPILNPDGFANAMQGSNVSEINFHWKFFGNTKDECPEAFYIWEYCKRVRPILYFDFHSYTFQDKEASSYIKPLGFYHGKDVRRIVSQMYKAVIRRCNGRYATGYVTYTPSTLQFELTRRFNTITFAKFHIHMKEGVKNSKRLAVDCFEDCLAILENNDVKSSSDIHLRPFGSVKCSSSNEIKIKMLLLWGSVVAFYTAKLINILRLRT